MAVFITDELTRMRQHLARLKGPGVDWIKSEANAAFQAVEDFVVNGRTVRPREKLDTAVDAATIPYVFTARDKDKVQTCVHSERGR